MGIGNMCKKRDEDQTWSYRDVLEDRQQHIQTDTIITILCRHTASKVNTMQNKPKGKVGVQNKPKGKVGVVAFYNVWPGDNGLFLQGCNPLLANDGQNKTSDVTAAILLQELLHVLSARPDTNNLHLAPD